MQAFSTAALRLAKQQKALDETAIEGFLLFPERTSSEISAMSTYGYLCISAHSGL